MGHSGAPPRAGAAAPGRHAQDDSAAHRRTPAVRLQPWRGLLRLPPTPNPTPPTMNQAPRLSWDDFRKQQREQQEKEEALVGSEKALRECRGVGVGCRGPGEAATGRAKDAPLPAAMRRRRRLLVAHLCAAPRWRRKARRPAAPRTCAAAG